MISVQNISKTFKLYQTPSDRLKEIFSKRSYHKSFSAVNDISFEVQEGETFGIVGENGAGKSTILKLLTGILLPDTGTIHINGKITGLLELGTGFNSEFSGIDNIIHNATYLGLTRKEIDDRLDAIIAFTELKDFINEPIKTYSSGMVMRLAFSVAIHADPTVFVVDEALSVGDAYFQQKCMKKIKAFKKKGGSIVFVSHDMNAVKVLCDKALLLEKGKMLEQGEPEGIINTYNFLIAKRSQGEKLQYQDTPISSSGYGNHKAFIEKISLINENNDPSEILLSGHPVKIIIQIMGHNDIEKLTLGFVIRDKYGQDIYGTNSYHLKKEISINQGERINVTYSFDQFNVGPGKYSITAALHTGSNHIDECFHWLDKGTVFEVISGNGHIFTGLLRLTPELYMDATKQQLSPNKLPT
ncbi:lipopolysaccharide transport system ATP-binding protein [Desulfocicer vacuolatum DSM 3385]|uniref:Lipopolysaccharide transport system ATP-binding protein n=1 Tax=Desulfocicer vacuolatum DSM 3385 TaxID=1121400 RepID=A0A1W2BV65_9BACT|nr:ABC transporter ATP-binding protein [Desulfocicer vacuolatum]SMC76616.1 lipopolysaccharide transport system ATP-binding protein [Desulfocicer vacuolatum DSM 3385]